MPFSINGIGTSLCPGRGAVSWGGEKDCDAMECFVILFLPILPMKCVHAFNREGNQYDQIDIRFDGELFCRVFLERWLLAPLVIGIIGLLMVPVVGLGLIALATLGWWLLALSDRRNRNIRLLLGQHDLGSSDPATWTTEQLDNEEKPRQMFGTDTYAQAVPDRLAQGDFAGAMWAARLSVASEQIPEGEKLTSTVLSNREVQNALKQVRKNPDAWWHVMRAGGQLDKRALERFQQGKQDPTEERLKQSSKPAKDQGSGLN
jgi:hypothetical protein